MECRTLPQQKIVYVCLNERETGVCCAHGGGHRIHAALKAAIKARGLSRQVRVSRSGCMDRCAKGPNVLLFPDGCWFSGVDESNVDTILEQVLQHLEPLD